MRMNSSAWIKISVAVPSMPASGWWIMIRLCGRALRLPLAPADSKQRAHAGALADAVGRHVARDPLHRVVDGQPRGHAAAGAVDVEMDVGLGVLMRQDQHLGDDQVGDGVIDRRAQDDDAVLEQAGIDIHRPLFTTAPFDHDRNQWHG